jgi:GT2 family glycosyltransferase
VGGFNEKLKRAGEDTLFNFQAKKLGVEFVTIPDALVDWEMPKSLGEAIDKFYFYAKGDAQANIWWHPSQRFSSHNLKILAIYGRYLLGLVLLIAGFYQDTFWLILFLGVLGYLLWTFFKNANYIKEKKALFWALVLQGFSDLAVMAGFASGIVLK